MTRLLKYLHWRFLVRGHYEYSDYIRHIGYICEFGMLTPAQVKRDMAVLARVLLMGEGDVTRHVWALMLDETEGNYYTAYAMVRDGRLSDLPEKRVLP